MSNIPDMDKRKDDDDSQVDNMLKERIRWGGSNGALCEQAASLGWVDRSNGTEAQFFKNINEKRATEKEAYLWSVADIFSSYNEYWKEMRKIFVFELVNPKRVLSFRSIRVEEVAFMIDSISQSSCKPIDLSEHLLSLTFTIICRIAFGREFDKIRFRPIVYECMETIGSYFAADLFPFFGCVIDVLTGQHSKLQKNFHNLDKFLHQVINQHIDSDQRRPTSQQDDIINILLGLEKGGVGPVQISKNRIKALLMVISLFRLPVFVSRIEILKCIVNGARMSQSVPTVVDNSVCSWHIGCKLASWLSCHFLLMASHLRF
ncbi:hypothetical protein C5167_030043 [Papaver somniferum]|nr:hypothetical protein C5167_030043 [Papaver somniferum]